MRTRPSQTLAAALLAAFALPAPAAQLCSPQIQATTPTARFQIKTDGTVLDRRTGLMWKRCPEGQTGAACAGVASGMNWSTAMAQAAGSTFAGYTNWRLPNEKELNSLVEYRCYAPAINLAVFPATPSLGFWTASAYANASGSAWIEGFDYGVGASGDRTNTYAVRMVRGGP